MRKIGIIVLVIVVYVLARETRGFVGEKILIIMELLRFLEGMQTFLILGLVNP